MTNQIQITSINILNSKYRILFTLGIYFIIYSFFYSDSIIFCMKTTIPDTGESKVEIIRGINELKNIHLEEKMSTPRALPTIIGSQITEGESFDAYVYSLEEDNLKLREENKNLQTENRRLMRARLRVAEAGESTPPRSPWGLLVTGAVCFGAGCAAYYLLKNGVNTEEAKEVARTVINNAVSGSEPSDHVKSLRKYLEIR